jgi:hypothetical protein
MRHHHCEAYAGENQKAGESESDGIHNHATFRQAGIYVGLLVARAVHGFVRLTVAPETALA